jgi:hypothetical protein
MSQPIPDGTRCRYKHRGDSVALSLGDLVVTVVRAHPKMAIMCEIQAKDGYRTWVQWSDLYVIKGGVGHRGQQ